ncbi:MAG: hypothetical protein DHS20C21_22340 [Gemmatimonadota bacterium]|nr:MAG: hypothetical protein DHS20C21_22340 [Gemmatimonadota bacterium]
MAHTFERAPTSRAKCRGCDGKIEKDTVRFGERLPNPYGEGEMTLWFHPPCAAHKRPEPFLEALPDSEFPVDAADALEQIARTGLACRRLPRLNGAERSPTARARCRSCRELIAKDTWRVALVFFEEGRFEASGYIHAGCVTEYFETPDVVERVRHFSEMSDADAADLTAAIAAPPSSP